ncbi:MAG TPA: hypothetical protein VKD23_17560, partial [Terriglobales bacterium]|nr:hypothetical protein [Terriglobales bacterium]
VKIWNVKIWNVKIWNVKIWDFKTWNLQAVSRTEAQARLVRWRRAARPARWTGEDARRSTVTKLSAWVP